MQLRESSVISNRTVGRPPKKPNQRERILNASARLFATLGYEQCTMARIAATLKLTPPALYHYFPTKQSIFTDVAITAMRGTYESVRDAVAAKSKCSYAQQLESLMAAHAKHFERNYWIVSATILGYGGIARRDIERLDEFESLRNKNESILVRLLRNGVLYGEFKSMEVKLVAMSIYQLLNISRWYRPGGTHTAVEIARKNYHLVAKSLLYKVN